VRSRETYALALSRLPYACRVRAKFMVSIPPSATPGALDWLLTCLVAPARWRAVCGAILCVAVIAQFTALETSQDAVGPVAPRQRSSD